MAKRKRNMQILFCVSPEEKKLIRRKMIESKTKNMGAYLRKMAIDGYIVNTDTNNTHNCISQKHFYCNPYKVIQKYHSYFFMQLPVIGY